MNTTVNAINEVPKLALNRMETAQAISQSPATVDRLTKRGLLRSCRANRRPLYAVKEIERFLKATTPDSDWTARKPLGETSFENFPPIFREPVGMSKTRNTSTLAGCVSIKSQHVTKG